MAKANVPRKTNNSPIARLRMAKGLTQAQLADMTALNPRLISRWENGTNSPRFPALKLIAKALDCTLDDLTTIKSDSL